MSAGADPAGADASAGTRPSGSRFAVLLDGPVTVTERLKGQVAGCRAIAADGAIRHAAPLGLVPELWVGDFDSAAAEHAEAHAGIPRRAFPADKDETDGEIAIRTALAAGARSLLLVGALGGRTDHALALLLKAARLAGDGIATMLTRGHEEAIPLTAAPLRPDWPPGTTFSVLAITDVGGLTMTGVRWPLRDHAVPMGSCLTLSNEVLDAPVLSVARGHAVAIADLRPVSAEPAKPAAARPRVDGDGGPRR